MTGPDISGSPWLLVSFTGGDGKMIAPYDKTKCTVEFRADGRAGVRIDINRGSRGWKLGSCR